MTEPQRLTEDEVKRFKELFDENQKLIVSAGLIQLQKTELQLKEEELKNDFSNFLSKQASIKNEMTLKYGDGTINTDSWTYIPNK